MSKRITNKKLAVVMVQRGIGTMELAQKCKLGYSTVSMLKCGWRKPTKDQIEKIEKCLGESNLFNETMSESRY